MKFIEVGVIFVPKVIHTYILVQGLGFGLGFTETLKFGFRFHQNQKSGFVRSLLEGPQEFNIDLFFLITSLSLSVKEKYMQTTFLGTTLGPFRRVSDRFWVHLVVVCMGLHGFFLYR